MHAPRASSAGLIVHIKLASPSPAGIVSAFAGRVEHSSSLTKLCAASPSIISGRSSNTRTIICSSTAERQPAGASADAAPSFRETLDSIDFLVPGVSTGADFQALGACGDVLSRYPSRCLSACSTVDPLPKSHRMICKLNPLQHLRFYMQELQRRVC